MYNERVKERYLSLDAIDANEYHVPILFKKTEPYEERLGKDLCNFTSAEIENFYKTEDYTSLNSMTVDNSAFVKYTNWCMSEFLVVDSQNHFLEFPKARLATYLNLNKIDKSILSKEQLDQWVKELQNPSDAFVVAAIFYGITGPNFSELWSLTDEDIDLKASKIRIKGKGWLEYPKSLCFLAIRSAEEKEYTQTTVRGERVVKLVDSNAVIKEMPNVKEDVDDFRKGRRIYHKLLRVLKYYDVADIMTARTISESGILYQMQLTGNLDFSNKEESEKLDLYYGEINRPTFLQKYGELLG